MNAEVSAAEFLRLPGYGLTLAADRWRAATGRRRGVVVLLHGGGQTRHAWRGTGAFLAGVGWDVVSLDLRGHGESDWAPGADDYSIEAFAADVETVVTGLGEAPLLVGASLGGIAAMLAAGEYGGEEDFARGLVLVDIVPRPSPAGVARIGDFMRRAPDGFATLEDAAAAIEAYNPRRGSRVNPKGLQKNLRQKENGRWYWHWDPAMMGEDQDAVERRSEPERVLAAAAAITVPTLLVRGTQSDIVTEEGAAELLSVMPQAKAIEVKGTGHMVAGDDNDVFTREVARFLSELP